jgi:hypothetical protein
MLNIPKAFLCAFLQKKKGAKSAGGDSGWNELADMVNNYESMAGNNFDDDSDSSSEDNDESEGHEGSMPIDMVMDRERDEADERLVDDCEELVEQGELDEDDLVLAPISVTERQEACVMLSKVHNIIIMQDPQ